MKQVTKHYTLKVKPIKRKPSKPRSSVRKNYKQPGTSKLEERFKEEFLDKLGVKYDYQYEAKDIGRWYDFYLPEHNIIIEIDGSYYHADPRVITEDKLTPMHKHNMHVDELKNRWALMHGIPIIRIWEKDINDSPAKVLEALRVRLGIEKEKMKLTEKKNKRHCNKIK